MKDKRVLSRDIPDVTAEAGAWLAQIETGRLSREDLAAFREWIQRSPRHYQEIRRLAEVSLQANVLTGMSGPLEEAVGRKRFMMRRPRSFARRRLGFLPVGGALLACAAILAITLSQPSPETPAPLVLQVATAIGEVVDLQLEDGSRLKLNTDSEIKVDFDLTERRVHLKTGEVYFEVARDPERLFVVHAGDRSVTAVGTAFSVRWTDEDLIVTVAEGSVSYAAPPQLTQVTGKRAEADDPPPATEISARNVLAAGQRLEVSKSRAPEIIANVPEEIMLRQLAWRSGLLDFDRMPLSQVVLEMQRYTPQTIVIEDQRLADLQFGGIFRIGQSDAFFEALEISFGIEVERTDDGKILLRSVY